MIAWQYCVGFCHTSTWISHRDAHVPSVLNFPPASHPSKVLHRSPIWVPWATEQIRTGIYFPCGNPYAFTLLISLFSQPSAPPTAGIHRPSLCVCVFNHQFSSVAQPCGTLSDPMDCSAPGLPVHHHLPESTQSHAHWVGVFNDALHIGSSIPLF